MNRAPKGSSGLPLDLPIFACPAGLFSEVENREAENRRGRGAGYFVLPIFVLKKMGRWPLGR